MAKALNGKVALVTGASRGIGRAIALRLAHDGAAVVVNYVGSAQQAQDAVGQIEKEGGRAVAVQADVSKSGDVKRLFDACFEKRGRLDILVNNAGVIFTKPVVEIGEEEFDRIFAINVELLSSVVFQGNWNQAAACTSPSTKTFPWRRRSNCSCPLSLCHRFWAA
jgi:3-oxoacyl-[acyl-carrier protein] reductase